MITIKPKTKERILWIKDILGNICTQNTCDNYRLFKDTKWKKQKSTKRYIVWCVKEDYVLILEERHEKVMLITAYCVLYKDKRNELESEYKKTKTPIT